MPDPEEVDVDLEADSEDWQGSIDPNDDSPYPVDNRHMLDSIYRICAEDTYKINRIYSAYDTLKIWITMLLYALFGGLIGLAMVRVLT